MLGADRWENERRVCIFKVLLSLVISGMVSLVYLGKLRDSQLDLLAWIMDCGGDRFLSQSNGENTTRLGKITRPAPTDQDYSQTKKIHFTKNIKILRR